MQSRCRSCNAEYLRRHYEANLAYYAEKAKRTKKRLKRASRLKIVEYLRAHPCVDRGETDPVVLQFDHVRGEKAANVGTLVTDGAAWERIAAEIEKCEVRCANCHWRRTAEQFDWYAFLRDDGGIDRG